MSSEGEDKAADWSGALQGAISEAGDEEDPSGIDVVSSGGLSGSSQGTESDNGELPYVVLLHAAARTVQSGEITVEEFIEGIGKLDAIADNALKIYAIPAVKNDLPGKLTDYQNSIVSALEVELHNLKKGLALMLTYPESKAVGDLEAGLKIAVASLNASNEIKKKADAEKAAILQREQDEKAVRAQKAAEADSD